MVCDGYRPIQCLHYVTQYGIRDAEAYLLEQTGDYSGALDVYVATFKKKLQFLTDSCGDLHRSNSSPNQENRSRDDFEKCLIECRDTLKGAEGLCRRMNVKTNVVVDETEELWLHLLDILVGATVSVRRHRDQWNDVTSLGDMR
jgi:hypothetical protein